MKSGTSIGLYIYSQIGLILYVVGIEFIAIEEHTPGIIVNIILTAAAILLGFINIFKKSKPLDLLYSCAPLIILISLYIVLPPGCTGMMFVIPSVFLFLVFAYNIIGFIFLSKVFESETTTTQSPVPRNPDID